MRFFLLKCLAEKHPETKAFVTEYHANMEDDNEEFDHLKNDDHDSLPLGDNDVERDGDDEDEDEDEVPREQVSFAAIQQECREVARNKVSSVYARSTFTLNTFAGH